VTAAAREGCVEGGGEVVADGGGEGGAAENGGSRAMMLAGGLRQCGQTPLALAGLMNEDTTIVATDGTRGLWRLIPAKDAARAHGHSVYAAMHGDGVVIWLLCAAHATFERVFGSVVFRLGRAFVAVEGLRLIWRKGSATARRMRMHPSLARVALCKHMDCVGAAVAQNLLSALRASGAHIAAGGFFIIVAFRVFRCVIVIRIGNCLPDRKGGKRHVPSRRNVHECTTLAPAERACGRVLPKVLKHARRAHWVVFALGEANALIERALIIADGACKALHLVRQLPAGPTCPA